MKRNIFVRIKEFYRIWVKCKCANPECNNQIENCIVYASFPPYITCGECGYIYDKDQRGEFIDD